MHEILQVLLVLQNLLAGPVGVVSHHALHHVAVHRVGIREQLRFVSEAYLREEDVVEESLLVRFRVVVGKPDEMALETLVDVVLTAVPAYEVRRPAFDGFSEDFVKRVVPDAMKMKVRTKITNAMSLYIYRASTYM